MKFVSVKIRGLLFLFAGSIAQIGFHLFPSGAIFAANARSESDWQRTVEAAKKEGKLGVFLYQRENIEAAVKAFERKFPDIQLITASTPAAETGPRIMAERRAGKFLWDI